LVRRRAGDDAEQTAPEGVSTMKDGFLPGMMIGVGLGVGFALLAPILLGGRREADGSIRPLAKQAVRTGLFAFERGKESLGEFGEIIEDLVAEVKAETILEQAKQKAPTES
jgi:hypothetical protein